MADTPQINNSVSIQLWLGGHSFSEPLANYREELAHAECVRLYIATPKTALLPAEFFREEHAVQCLAAVGAAPSHDECVVVDRSMKDIVALMAVSCKALDELHELYDGRVEYLTPMFADEPVSDGVVLRLTHGVLYVRIYSHGALQLAEALTAVSDADVIYNLGAIDEVYSIFNMNARARGELKRLAPLAKRMFRNLSCE